MKQAGPLKVVEVYKNPESKWVILFHGFGADANDLASLAKVIPTKKDCNWLFPNGPLEVAIGAGFTGAAWWNLLLSDLTGDWTIHRPKEMSASVEKALKLISSMKVPWKDIILGGFSQGAMLATEIFLKAPETPAGLISLSGTLISQKEWKEEASKRKGSTVFISHGQHDGVLPLSGSVKLQSFFESCGIKTEFVSFSGAHEIPPVVIQKMKSYIDERL